MTVILANQKSIEFSVAELAVWLVLLLSLRGIVSILDSCYDGRVERINLLRSFHSILVNLLLLSTLQSLIFIRIACVDVALLFLVKN